ncbi:MAG: DNA oxidative demethylase AlkB [Gammaproteobacteria bacterium]|nr:DNA oxidative demethylase AlkB [Gammaproteobacteria bacterium]
MLDFGPEGPVSICPGMWLLRRYADPKALKPVIEAVCGVAALRRMMTPGGRQMSVKMSNCGRYGWVSDRSGYRYQPEDPLTSRAWPAMPDVFAELSTEAAAVAGYTGFIADACLINCYEPGTGMTAHQDCNEQDFTQPIVSVSLGIPARFFVQGAERRGKSIPVDLESGDVVVWGGESRRYYHGVRPLKHNSDIHFGECRYNLTFRRAY